jgi:hypothetical protein
MNRITVSFSDVTANGLEWLSKRTMRKPSNLLAFLLSQEIERQLEAMTLEERNEVYAQLSDYRVLCLDVHPA